MVHFPCIMSDSICDMCGGETVHDRREGRVVCIECGAVLQEWTICDDVYEASTRCAPSGWDLGTGNAPDRRAYGVKRRKDSAYAVKQKISNYVAVHGLGDAIEAKAGQMLSALDQNNVEDSVATAWTIISLACDSVKASRPMTVMAACAGVSTKKLLELRKAMMAILTSFFDDGCDDDSNDLDTAVKRILGEIFPMHARMMIMESRKAVLRRAAGLKSNGGFMNICPVTQARVLLVEHFRSNGTEMTAQMKSALKVASGGVKSGLMRIEL